MIILKNIIGFILLSLLFVVCNKEKNESVLPQAHEVDKAEKVLLETSNELGYSYFSKLVIAQNESKNLLISPINATLAFNLLLNISETATKKQIKQFLRINHLEDSSATEGFDKLNHLFAQIDSKTKIESFNKLAIGNELKTKPGLNKFINERDYLEITAKDPAPFNEKKESNNSLQLVNSQNISAEVKFQKGTNDLPFYNTPDEISFVKMLAVESNFNQYSDPTIEAVELPIGRGNYNLLMIMPQGSQTINEIIQKLDNRLVDRIKSKFKPKPLEVYLPLLEVSDLQSYKDVLKKGKISNCFNDAKVNFSGFSNSKATYLSEFSQITNFNLTTSDNFYLQKSIGNKNSLLIDRPFLFIIYEKYSDAVILLGKISHL